MAASRRDALTPLLLAALLTACAAGAKDTARPAPDLRARLAAGLNAVAGSAIEHPDDCASAQRPLPVGTEVAAMLAQALRVSPNLRTAAECRAIGDADGWQECRFFFHSSDSRQPWTLGLTFLAKPAAGAVRGDTVACFATP